MSPCIHILVLEDDQSKEADFKRAFKDVPKELCQLHICETVLAAKEECKNYKFDAYTLDYDLPLSSVLEVPFNGEDFCHYLAEHKPTTAQGNQPLVYLHTENENGAYKMMAVLPQARWCPFHEAIWHWHYIALALLPKPFVKAMTELDVAAEDFCAQMEFWGHPIRVRLCPQ